MKKTIHLAFACGVLFAAAAQSGTTSMPGNLQSLISAIRTGDQAFVDQHVTRIVQQRVFKAEGEKSTSELKNSQLIELLRGCDVTGTTPVDLGLGEGEITHQVLWSCPAKGEKPALIGQTTIVGRGEKFEVVVFFLPAGLPSIRTSAPSSERGSN